MELQLFGEIETTAGPASAMLCRDIDLPDEAVLHWWRQDQKSAIQVALKPGPEGGIELIPNLIFHVTPRGGLIIPPTRTAEEEAALHSYRATVFERDGAFEGQWQNNEGQSGRVSFRKPIEAGDLTPVVCAGWREFKDWASNVTQTQAMELFRGHGSNQFELDTSFHRAGLRRVERYCSDTLREFGAQAEVALGFKINMNDPDDFSMVLGLAQHHGLPTPMLDWTRSPYIAAFFAFADAIDGQGARTDGDYVRVYGLTKDFLKPLYTPNVELPLYRPYIAPLAVSGRNNPRLHAQQGRFLVTNYWHVERHIRAMESADNKTYLVAADVPIASALEALEDLDYMGLSAASLFPGLDGLSRSFNYARRFRRRASAVGHAAPTN
jgi:hypothetical protein